ncbi:hypothetical protein L1887_48961 [Cichorium endivia]|nr:hypothetical protein L1887_48961 [Cichorium endivia]
MVVKGIDARWRRAGMLHGSTERVAVDGGADKARGGERGRAGMGRRWWTPAESGSRIEREGDREADGSKERLGSPDREAGGQKKRGRADRPMNSAAYAAEQQPCSRAFSRLGIG